MTREQSDARHAAAEDERARSYREKRIHDKAAADAHDLARKNAQALLPYTELRYDPDDEGCVW